MECLSSAPCLMFVVFIFSPRNTAIVARLPTTRLGSTTVPVRRRRWERVGDGGRGKWKTEEASVREKERWVVSTFIFLQF